MVALRCRDDHRRMPNYRRAWTRGGTFFFTINLLERRRTLLVDHVDALRAAFRHARAARPFEVIAIVVLPDHLHCVWRLPEGDDDNATRWRHIKTLFSRSIPAGERLSPRRRLKGERGIWQRRYWEHLIRDEDDFLAHVDYVHINPVKHGLVTQVMDWPYSSFHRFVRTGHLPACWGGNVRTGVGSGERAEAGQDPPYGGAETEKGKQAVGC